MTGRSIFGPCPGTQRSRFSKGTGYIVSRGATWSTRTGLRWFVRAAAVFVALVNSSHVILWLVGGLHVLGGEDASTLGEAAPSLLLAVIAGLVTSEIVLRVFELLGRDFLYRCQAVVNSMCLGGAIEGGRLSLLYAIDGTMFPAPPPSIYAHPVAPLYILLVGLFGAGIGLGIGLAEGLILGLPLAAALGTFGDSRESGGVRREPAVGGPAWEQWRWALSSSWRSQRLWGTRRYRHRRRRKPGRSLLLHDRPVRNTWKRR